MGRLNMHSWCALFFPFGVGVGGVFFLSNYVSNVCPCHQPRLNMVTNNFRNQSFMQSMSVFFKKGDIVVFWLLGSSQLFIFTFFWLKSLLRIMCSLKVSTREKDEKKLKKMTNFQKLTSQLVWDVRTSQPRCWLLWRSSQRTYICQDCVLWKEEGVFQDFTYRWCVRLNLKYGSCFCKSRVFLTHNNIMKKTITFCKYKMKKISSTFPCVFVELDGVTKVFYEHTNLGSRLKEIGR